MNKYVEMGDLSLDEALTVLRMRNSDKVAIRKPGDFGYTEYAVLVGDEADLHKIDIPSGWGIHKCGGRWYFINDDYGDRRAMLCDLSGTPW